MLVDNYKHRVHEDLSGFMKATHRSIKVMIKYGSKSKIAIVKPTTHFVQEWNKHYVGETEVSKNSITIKYDDSNHRRKQI